MLSQNTRQEQSLSQYQMQALRMLSLDGAALDHMLQKEELDNPVFELDRAASPAYTSLSRPAEDDGSRPIERVAAMENDLPGYLESQLPHRGLNAEETRVFRRMVEFLEPRTGILPETVQELSGLLGAPLDVVERCLALLHGMEPAGVGAASVSESLILQAHRRGWTDPKLYAILFDHLEDIAARRYRRIMSAQQLTLAQVEDYAAHIQTLEPYPTAAFGDEPAVYIVPDLVFAPDDDGVWRVQVRDRWSDGVPYSPLYTQKTDHSDPALYEYLRERRQHAAFVLQCVEQRRMTLARIGECVLETQLPFLTHGEPLRTLTREDLAERTGLSASTVSRAFKDKYVQTPTRVYPFAFFLSRSSGKRAAGGDSSRSQALAVLGRLIREEDPAAPLSDEQLASLLAAEDIRLSRRTIAKYRMLLGIPGTYERKR